LPRRMREAGFREDQWTRRYEPHVAPINRFVDELCTQREESVPYVAPMYGGVNARLLSVLRDPGPMTQEVNRGSGFLCMENDDASAALIHDLFSSAGIDATHVVPWNAYPWYINRAPKAAELERGAVVLALLLDLIPKIRVVMLHGGSARDGWKRLTRNRPNLVRERDLTVIETYHTSRQAFWHRDPSVREHRKLELRRSFGAAAICLAQKAV
jgi:hypothetical protein